MAQPSNGAVNLPTSTVTISQPSLTWYCDQAAGRIQGTVDNYDAVFQAVQIIMNTERFYWQIYKPTSGVTLTDLIGQNPGYVAAMIQRRCQEALKMDDRVIDIDSFSYTFDGRNLTATFRVLTVYGNIIQDVEVSTT